MIGSLLGAGVGLIKYLADPYNLLPAITFWLLGSLAATDPSDLLPLLGPVALGTAVLLALRWRMTVLSLDEGEARTLGFARRCCASQSSLPPPWSRLRALQPPASSDGGTCQRKEGSAAERDTREALGRSGGGYGTKACVIADGPGRAIAFRRVPGQAYQLPHAIPLLDQLPCVPKWLVGGRGYTSHLFREYIWNMGARPAIPPKRNEALVACPDWIYNNRNHVERLGARLKEWRAIATRYEKTAVSFMGALCLAAAIDWLKR